MEILYVASESSAIISTGKLGETVMQMARSLKREGHDVRVVIPMYADIPDAIKEKAKFLTRFTVDVTWRKQQCDVYEVTRNTVKYYLISSEYYFNRNGIYEFYDDAERFIYFSRAVLELIDNIDFEPEIIHSNDWQTGLIPAYYSLYYKDKAKYQDIKNVFTVHNAEYQGEFSIDILDDVVGINAIHSDSIVDGDSVNFMKAGVCFADKVTTVSKGYGMELMHKWYSKNLAYTFRENEHKMSAVTTGIDTTVYNPETDKKIPFNYSADDRKGKIKCKENIMEIMGCHNKKAPLIVYETTFFDCHGVDMVVEVFDEIKKLGFNIAVLGLGATVYEKFFFNESANSNGSIMYVQNPKEKEKLAFLAGADFMLLPYKSEPNAKDVMVAMRYGTVPVVLTAGGARDIVVDCGDKNGNALTFQTASGRDMLSSLERAAKAYSRRQSFGKIVSRIMKLNFDVKNTAKEYSELYNKI